MHTVTIVNELMEYESFRDLMAKRPDIKFELLKLLAPPP
jgi:hypothetical protein